MNITEFPHILKAAELANDSVIVESLHGVGKSDAVKQFAKDNNYYCQELFLSMMDTGDILGIPRTLIAGSSTITVWAEPAWFKQIKDRAWPEELDYSALNFIDPKFKEYVDSELSRS